MDPLLPDGPALPRLDSATMTAVSCLPGVSPSLVFCRRGVGGACWLFIHQFVHSLLPFTTVNSKYSLVFGLVCYMLRLEVGAVTIQHSSRPFSEATQTLI